MDYNDLTEEQKAKVRACKTAKELYALARKEGVELNLEELEGVSGGWGCNDNQCQDDCPYRNCANFMFQELIPSARFSINSPRRRAASSPQNSSRLSRAGAP